MFKRIVDIKIKMILFQPTGYKKQLKIIIHLKGLLHLQEKVQTVWNITIWCLFLGQK